jgi:DNA polymerase-3 subunit gamma/tau
MPGLFEDEPPADTGPGLFGDDPPATVPVHAAAYRVLARTYRPINFDDLIGQDAMVRTLRNAFSSGRVAHAFMLTGVRGVGKTTTARIIARCLNCIGPDGAGGPTADPCGVCPNCRSILADRHPDVIEMDAASKNGIDDVREIIEATRYRPMQARTKVFIIDEVHMLSKAAFNALLKTLEEPPPHVKFVFATTELRKVPVTVLSRCQRFDLRRVSIDQLTARFAHIATQERVAVSAEALQMIARAADGSVRDGLSLLDQAIAQLEVNAADPDAPISAESVAAMLGLADRTLVFDLLEAVLGGRLQDALAITDRAHDLGVDFGTLLQDLLELVHTVTRLQSVPSLRQGQELPEAERIRGGAMADKLSVPELARAWQILLRGLAEVETAPDRRAAAEMVLIRLCHVADLPTPGDLVRRLKDSAVPAAPSHSGGPPTAGVRAVANGAPMASAAPEPAIARQFTSLRDVAAAVAEDRAQAQLHAHLVHSVHVVRFAQGLIEFRPEPDAPRQLAAALGAFLLGRTGQRWTIAISTEPGEPTLAQQGEAAGAARRSAAEAHPLVKAIMDAFPGATLSPVQDSRADAYGLYGEAPIALGGSSEAIDLSGETAPDMPPFAPDDAEPAGLAAGS